jgi:hypothetical protein
MKRKILIKEIIEFNKNYGLFHNSIDENKIKNMLGIWLEETHHIESLINIIIVKANNTKNINKKKLKNLILELERIRLDLEYK